MAANRLKRASVPLGLALLVGAAALASGPSTFDAVDGAELSLAGSRLEIAHPPGHPLLLMLLRVWPATSYAGQRLLTSLIAGIAAAALYGALRSFRLSAWASAAASILVSLSPPVLGQLNLLEIHGLSLLLCSLAVMYRRTPAGGYALGLAIFGGHPIAVCLAPLVLPRRAVEWKWMTLAALPATLLLYVPLRASDASLLHYAKPETFSQWFGYLGMYQGKLAGPGPGRLWELLSALGPAVAGAVAILLIAGRPRSWRVPAAAVIALLFMISYDVRDLPAYWWLALLALSPWIASGIQNLTLAVSSRLPVALLVAAAAASGLIGAWRADDRAAWTAARDMMRGAGIQGIYCTVGHQTFYAAYLIGEDDVRPDLLAADLYGNIFGLRVFDPQAAHLPDSIGGRVVYATRAWSTLPLHGLLFTVEDPGLDWSRYEVFESSLESPDPLARDQLAECWLRRGAGSEGQARERAFAVAESLASTSETRERVDVLRRR